MNALSRAVLVVLCCVALAAPAVAGSLKLEIRNGRVTLEAQDVAVRDILAEWARVGQTRIVNREQVGGGLVTLTLTNVPEKDALEILLRSVSGYIAAPRATPVADGSMYDVLYVLATPRPTTVQAGTGGQNPSLPYQRGRAQGPTTPGGNPAMRVIQQPPDDAADDVMPPVMRPGFVVEQSPYQTSPGQMQIQLSPGMMASPAQPVQGSQAQPYTTATPGQSPTPGVVPSGSTSVPGMMAPTTPATPPKPIKPPGGPSGRP